VALRRPKKQGRLPQIKASKREDSRKRKKGGGPEFGGGNRGGKKKKDRIGRKKKEKPLGNIEKIIRIESTCF